MSSGSNFAFSPPTIGPTPSVTLPEIGVDAPPLGSGGGGGALPGDGSYGDPIAGFHQINQQFADNQRAFSAQMDSQANAANALFAQQGAERQAQMQATTEANLASMNAQRAALFAPPPITGPLLPPNFRAAAEAAPAPLAPGLVAFGTDVPAPAADAGTAVPATNPGLAAAGAMALRGGTTLGETLAAGGEAIGGALPTLARLLPPVAAGAAFAQGFFGDMYSIPDQGAETRMRLDSEARLKALGLRPGATVPEAVPAPPAQLGEVAAPAVQGEGGLALTPSPEGLAGPLPGFTGAVPQIGPEGFLALPQGFGPLPGFAAAPPLGMALPGLTPAGQTPPLPGFGAVDPALGGALGLAIGADPGLTRPTGPVDGLPTGTAPRNVPFADPAAKAQIASEQRFAGALAAAGYQTVRQPTVGPDPAITPERLAALGLAPTRNPDLLVEGRIFDIYTPVSDALQSVAAGIAAKVADGQTDRIALDLTGTPFTDAQVRAVLRASPIAGLKEVITLTKTGLGRAFP